MKDDGLESIDLNFDITLSEELRVRGMLGVPLDEVDEELYEGAVRATEAILGRSRYSEDDI